MSQPFPHVEHDGERFYLACLPPRPDFGGFRRFATANDLIPRERWHPVDLESFLGEVWNQGQHGSCVGHGSGKAFEGIYRMARFTVPTGGFSPTDLYSQINGGRDAGAIVSDAMDALISTGIGLMSEVPESVIYDRQIPESAKATRKRFRVRDAFHVGTFDAIVSALHLGFLVSFGITIRSGFNRPGPGGVIEPGGMVLGGHCMCAYGVVKLPDGRWALKVRNSWGTSWGDGGNCILPEGHFVARDLDAFAVRDVLADPMDPNRPPIAR